MTYKRNLQYTVGITLNMEHPLLISNNFNLVKMLNYSEFSKKKLNKDKKQFTIYCMLFLSDLANTIILVNTRSWGYQTKF